MANVFDAAKYILEKQGAMSTWKLQKLCYYAQVWHYAWTEKALFIEEFQAWRNGPVCPALFNMHRGRFIIGAADLPYGSADNLSADEKESVDVVLDTYGSLEPHELVGQTHSEEPWKIARGNLPADAPCTEVISLESMGAYYGALAV